MCQITGFAVSASLDPNFAHCCTVVLVLMQLWRVGVVETTYIQNWALLNLQNMHEEQHQK